MEAAITKAEKRLKTILQKLKVGSEEGGLNAAAALSGEFLLKALGGSIVEKCSSSISDYETDMYLVPLKKEQRLLDTNSISGGGVFILGPMALNEKFFPLSSKLEKATYGIEYHNNSLKEKTIASNDSNDNDSITQFEFKIEEEPSTVALPIKKENEIDERQEEEEEKFERESMPPKPVLTRLGVSAISDEVRATFEEAPGRVWRAKDYRTLGDGNELLKEEVTKSETLVMNGLGEALREGSKGSGAFYLDDRKIKRKRGREERNSKLDKWFGMERKEINEDLRREFRAIDLRGYNDKMNMYAGKKRRFELAEAKSGFFDIGYVVDGGLDGVKISEGSSLVKGKGFYARAPKPRNAKSLAKQILKS